MFGGDEGNCQSTASTRAREARRAPLCYAAQMLPSQRVVALLTSVLILLSSAAAAAAGGVTIKEIEDNGVQGLKASFVVDEPRDVVFETLNDLAGFKTLFPNVLEVKVVRTDGDTRDVYFKVDAVLSEAEYTLRRTAARGKVAHTISWNRLSGDANIIRGSWILVDGKKPGTTRVTYRSFVDVSAFVPTGTVRDIAVGKVHEMVDRVRAACRARAGK